MPSFASGHPEVISGAGFAALVGVSELLIDGFDTVGGRAI
jgi:hypothetical protein